MRRPPAVARVLERVTRTAREHEMVAAGDTVLVACSGGPDSTCLLYALHHLRRLLEIELAVFHFDHRLRPGSPKDGEYVRRLAERLELPFHLRIAEDAPSKGESVESWARTVRSLAGERVADAIGARRLAEGHTLDDQAETVLMALLRGADLHGLVGIRPVLGAQVQPLLDVTREEVEAFCRSLGLRPRLDPTNRDTRRLRNALRLRGIPALERATGREIRRPIARSADLLRPVESEWLETVRVGEGDRISQRGGLPARRGCTRSALPGGRARDDPGGIARDGAPGRPGVDRRRPRSRCRSPGPKAGPGERIEGSPRAGVCFPLSHFPREPGVKGGEMEGRVVLSELEDTVRVPSLDTQADARERDIERILIGEQEIADKLRELGDQITRDYEGREPLLIGVLKGAFLLMADLCRHIRLPLQVDFMAVASYGAATKTSGVVRILKDLDHDLEGRDVLLVEDIVDSGLTLNYLLKNLRGRRPASLEVCALLKKTGIQRVHLDVKYVGFEIPPDFVVGYGLDFAERFRNVPYVGLLRPEAYTDL